MLLDIEGEFIAPPHGSDDTVTVVEPVTFTGDFNHGFGMNVIKEALVANDVTATTTLQFFDFPSAPSGWEVEHIRYDIAGSTTPEPSSLLLLGSGVAGLMGRRVWRKRRAIPRASDAAARVTA